MMTEKERYFIQYWEKVREPESKPLSKLIRGLPMAIIFCAPIFLSPILVYYFSPDWYTKISAALTVSVPTMLLALFILIVFIAYFRMHFKWEQNEQYYLELKEKLNRDAAN
ncbi:MAG: hypothetical protein JST95_09895 [Bacteroidetes bacterium]|nr:hypothetical protein [Bacteroidota bacterium]